MAQTRGCRCAALCEILSHNGIVWPGSGFHCVDGSIWPNKRVSDENGIVRLHQPVMQVLWTWTAVVAFMLAGPAKLAVADEQGSGTPAQGQRSEAALPFSTADFGWLLLVAAVLLVLAFALQQLARRRRRALRSMARQRTDP